MRCDGRSDRQGDRGRWVRVLAGLAVGPVLATAACATAVPRGEAGGGAAAAVPALSTVEASEPPGSSSVHPVTTVVVTDDPAVSAAEASGEEAWPGLLAAELGRTGAPATITSAAADGAGYAADGGDGPTFTDLVVEQVVHSTQLVIVFDTELGGAGAPAVEEGAAAAFKAVEEQAPDALLVVVAPYRFSPDAPAPTEDVRGAVRAAADGAEVAVTYIDPVAEGWPTGIDQQQIASLIHAHIAELAGALARSGAFD